MGYEHAGTNSRSGSTTWVPRVDKLRRPRPAGAARAAGASRWSSREKRDPKAPLTITVRYRGGGEAWYYVEGRGGSGAFPGYRSIHDVMREINEGRSYRSGGGGA